MSATAPAAHGMLTEKEMSTPPSQTHSSLCLCLRLKVGQSFNRISGALSLKGASTSSGGGGGGEAAAAAEMHDPGRGLAPNPGGIVGKNIDGEGLPSGSISQGPPANHHHSSGDSVGGPTHQPLKPPGHPPPLVQSH